ncbi:MAG: ATPase, P-type (transporting), superfamily, subfamily [Parachlamydiales bacterium]|nr:ATPase, P-type (transporting), superfamily, subfamily [Parachlamydiales bacterium]
MDVPPSPHSQSIQALFEWLHSNPNGLSSLEAAERLKAFGKNQLEDDQVSGWAIFFRQFKSLFIYVLLAASIISLILGAYNDFCVIIGIVLINALIGFWQEAKAEKAIRALKKLTQSRVRVQRDGQMVVIDSPDLAMGDCVFLQEGELMTADMRLIEDTSLLADESSLTGESVPVGKDSSMILPSQTQAFDWQNMVLAGTAIVRGQGKALVVRTGKNTYLASIAKKINEAAPLTPLTKAIQSFSTKYVFGLVALFLLFIIIGYFQGRHIVDLSYIIVACLVSAVPEGLPLVITLVITIGAVAMSKKHTLIRVLSSLETLGSATVIACDKTGTITQGQLIVDEWIGDDFEKLQLIGALCNDAPNGSADPIDRALWRWANQPEALHAKYPRKWSYPFDAKAMLMAVVHEIDGRETLLIKGAYESLNNLSDPDPNIERSFERLLEKGDRVLALGIGNWNGNPDHRTWKIRIVGLVGFLDPPKEGVKEAVAVAKGAHIRVMMLTGDHPLTARHVAQNVGIWTEGSQVLTGRQMQDLNPQELRKKLLETSVVARMLPEHKYQIVKSLQEIHEIVAVTGDGVNDVPALRAADLGIAMGGGTEAAKAVSQMVITDNNFKVIVDAIQQGRVITDNLRKVLYYLISTSLQEICLIAFSIFAFFPIPLSAIQILWINLVTDSVQAQSFALIKEEGDVMKRRPKKPSQKFFDRVQIIRILTFSFVVGAFVFGLYAWLRSSRPFVFTSSIIFTCTVTAQWANGIQAQKESEPFFKNIRRSLTINPWIFCGIGAGLLLQLAALYLFPAEFSAVPLGAKDWLYPIAAFFFAFFFVEARKWAEYFFLK